MSLCIHYFVTDLLSAYIGSDVSGFPPFRSADHSLCHPFLLDLALQTRSTNFRMRVEQRYIYLISKHFLIKYLTFLTSALMLSPSYSQIRMHMQAHITRTYISYRDATKNAYTAHTKITNFLT